MAKQIRHQKQTQVQSRQGNGIQHEHVVTFDDSLLPDASEIKALSEIDPNIIEWLKEKAGKEQDFRHEAYLLKTNIIKSETRAEVINNRIGLFFAFLIIMSGMGLSTFLIYEKQIVAGSIFSGITIISAAALFIKRNKN